MSDINVRLASQSDSKDIIRLLGSEEFKKDGYDSSQSVQNLLANKSNRIFVAEDEDDLCAVVVTCVLDGGVSFIIKEVHIREAYNQSDLVSELLTGVYSYLGSHFKRLKKERFVSSSTQIAKLFEQHIKTLRTSHITSGKFVKLYQLEQQVLEIGSANEISSTKLDTMVRNSSVVHLKRKEADLYVLRNLSSLSSQVILVDSIPHALQISSIDSVFINGEYLFGEKQTEHLEHRNRSLHSGSTNIAISGRNSPTRLQSSHMVNVLENLHSSLRNINGCLESIQSTLNNALPKSFSHGKQVKSGPNTTWEAVIYSKDSDFFRAHALEQFRIALLQLKANFKFVINFHSAMSNEAIRLFTKELGLTFLNNGKKIDLYERCFDFSMPNGLVKV